MKLVVCIQCMFTGLKSEKYKIYKRYAQKNTQKGGGGRKNKEKKNSRENKGLQYDQCQFWFFRSREKHFTSAGVKCVSYM